MSYLVAFFIFAVVLVAGVNIETPSEQWWLTPPLLAALAGAIVAKWDKDHVAEPGFGWVIIWGVAIYALGLGCAYRHFESIVPSIVVATGTGVAYIIAYSYGCSALPQAGSEKTQHN